VATHVERSIEVGVPVRTAYDQWTQFEEFPRFMSGVQEVVQVGDAMTHWVAEIAGVRREWDAAIVEQVPDEKVAWAATSGATNAGAVHFTAVDATTTRVLLTLDYEPEGIVEKIADVFNAIDRQAVADLDRFKEFIEDRGRATGGWRGTVEEGDATPSRADRVSAAGAVAGGTVGVGAVDAGREDRRDLPGDVVEVGPTGAAGSTLETEETPARTDPGPADPSAGIGGVGGDPVAVDGQTSTLRTETPSSVVAEADAAGAGGPVADAAAGSAGVAGFGTAGPGGLTGDAAEAEAGVDDDPDATAARTPPTGIPVVGGPGGTDAHSARTPPGGIPVVGRGGAHPGHPQG
jgi:carbon monoxide dehydrogenase subunit G